MSIHICDNKFVEVALKDVDYGEGRQLMLSFSKGNVIEKDGQEIRKHDKSFSIPFERSRIQRLKNGLEYILREEDG